MRFQTMLIYKQINIINFGFYGVTKMQKRSILNTVIRLNLIMILIVTILFVTSGGLYANQLAKERYNMAHTTLAKLNKDVQLEMHRLDTLLTLCMQDASIVFSISDKLDSEFFLANSYEAAQKLALIRQSLPYAEKVFLYTKHSQRVVLDNGAIYAEDDFIRLVLNKTLSAPLTDISTFPEGLYRYNDKKALYVQNLYSHGYVAVLINLSEFADVNKTMGEDFLGYVIQKDGTSIIEYDTPSLSESELNQALNSDYVELDGTKYYCVSSPMNVIPYTGLVLINNDALMQPLNYMKTIMIITFVVLFASSVLLVLLNYKIYLPLKRFSSQFSDSTENEILVIENEVHKLLSEINMLRDKSHSSDIIPEKIALHYLLSGGGQLNQPTMDMLEQKYPYYMLIVLTIQNHNGNEDLYLGAALEKELSSRFALKFINIGKYRYCMIAKPEDKDKLLLYCQSLLHNTENVQIYAGIREYCVDIKELYAEYKSALECLLSAQAQKKICFSYSEATIISKNSHLNTENRQRIFEYIRNNASSQLSKEFQQLFYPADGHTLSDFQYNYYEVLSLIEKACISLKNKVPDFVPKTDLYNTEYMYHTIISLVQEIMSSQQKQPHNMKQRMEEYIQLHISEPLTLDTVAEAFAITPVYLSSWFKKNMDMNFLAYISGIRMEYAKDLLQQPNPPKIYEVALAVGIDNVATFIRQFKKHTGVTPSQYQKNIQNIRESD